MRCACALALASLLLPLRPRGVSGGEWPPQALPGPRAASWLGNFGKYVKKLFNVRWAGGKREGGAGEGSGAACGSALLHPRAPQFEAKEQKVQERESPQEG